MPVAPDIAILIAKDAAAPELPSRLSVVDLARQTNETDVARFSPAVRRDPVDRIEEMSIPVEGSKIPGRLYLPEAPRATLLWIHGGGWVLGSLETGDVVARALAARAQLAVLSIDYRLAPEYPWPTPYDDSLAAAQWLLVNQQHILGAEYPLLVGGDSAGGNLAAAVALELKSALAGQILVYPVIAPDAALEAFPSRVVNGQGYHITWDVIEWAIDQYLPAAANREHERVAVHRAADLAQSPPAVVVTVEYDPLRDEGKLYGNLLKSAGVHTALLDFEGLVHGSFDMIGSSKSANSAMDTIAISVGELLSARGQHG